MDTSERIPVLERLSALADPTRSRLLLVLDRHELTVSELCAVLQLPQSTVSRHLRILSDEGWVTSRADGTSRFYVLAPRLDDGARQLWELVRAGMQGDAAATQDAQRLGGVLSQRRTRSREFFAEAAGAWDTLRSELFGYRPDLFALPGLLDEKWTVGDLGSGTGQLAEVLAPFVRRIVAVDASEKMLASARQRLDGFTNIDFRVGEMEALPVGDGELDAAVVSLVLHYVAEPPRALAEIRRTLDAGGRLLLVDMMPHTREEFRQKMGHVWLGFGEAQLREWLAEAGFRKIRYRPLPPSPEARGPVLFAVSAKVS